MNTNLLKLPVCILVPMDDKSIEDELDKDTHDAISDNFTHYIHYPERYREIIECLRDIYGDDHIITRTIPEEERGASERKDYVERAINLLDKLRDEGIILISLVVSLEQMDRLASAIMQNFPDWSFFRIPAFKNTPEESRSKVVYSMRYDVRSLIQSPIINIHSRKPKDR